MTRFTDNVGHAMKSEVVYEDLGHENVLVTGGESGFGFAVAKAFARNGSNVVIVGRDDGKLKRAKKELGRNSDSFTFDLTDIDRLPDLVCQIADSVGENDILVNNAGVNLKKDALGVSNQESEPSSV
jgi:NADP-dependent 3-hydroxy acid dehydrogenase YdfG